MASLSVLANVPGYGGYLARRGQIEEQQATQQQQELAQAGALQKLYQNQQTMRTSQEDRARTAQDEAQLKSVMDATGGDPQRAIEALLKAGTPKSIELASKLKGLLPAVEKAAEQWSEPYKPGSFGCHELLDRTSMAGDMVEHYVLSHPACAQNQDWYALADQAVAALRELYQRIGEAHLADEDTTADDR